MFGLRRTQALNGRLFFRLKALNVEEKQQMEYSPYCGFRSLGAVEECEGEDEGDRWPVETEFLIDGGWSRSIPLPLPPMGPPLRDPRGLPRLLVPLTLGRIRTPVPEPKFKWWPNRATFGGSPNWEGKREFLKSVADTGPSTSTTRPSLLVSSFNIKLIKVISIQN